MRYSNATSQEITIFMYIGKKLGTGQGEQTETARGNKEYVRSGFEPTNQDDLTIDFTIKVFLKSML